MNNVEKVIAIAKQEVGYLEKKTNSQLDSKTANAGSANYTKYARDIDRIKGYFNGAKNGYAWCAVFVNWCFIQAYGAVAAKSLLCQPAANSCAAGCVEAVNYFKSKNQFFKTPKVGDQIFFSGSRGEAAHTGLVYKVDAATVYTIEGNTSSAAGVVANGGSVAYKSYPINYNRICGYGRPHYDTKPIEKTEVEEMRYYKLGDCKTEAYKQTLKKLIKKGIIKGKGGEGDNCIIDLGEDAVRILVYLDREGIFG